LVKKGFAEKIEIIVLSEDKAGYNSPCWAQHGICFYVKAVGEWGECRLLFDAGWSPEPILHNAEVLGVRMEDVEYIVLSHSHFDHTGGLAGVLRRIGRGIPIIAHPLIFKDSFIVEPKLLHAGIPLEARRVAEELGCRWMLSRDPVIIAPGIMTTGEVSVEERVDFEKQPTGILMLSSGRIINDPVEDEIALVIRTRRGLVILTGCSHPGVISVIKKSISLTSDNRVLAVIGGFHLVSANEERITKTARKLLDIGVEKVYTGHCTGFKAECILLRMLGERLTRLHTGMRITFP